MESHEETPSRSGNSEPPPPPEPVPADATVENPPQVEDEVKVSDADSWITDDETILRALDDQEQVVPFLGAGVSQAAGLPGGGALADFLRDRFDPHPEVEEFSKSSNPLHAADEIACRDFEIESQVQEAVAEFWDEAVERTPSHDLLKRLARIPSKLIVTLCYDQSLERAAEAVGIECDSWDGLHHLRPFTELVLRDREPEKLTIMHLHGRTPDPPTIVLGAESYASALNQDMTNLAQALMRDRTLCFLGITLDEPYILTALEGTTKRRGRSGSCGRRRNGERSGR